MPGEKIVLKFDAYPVAQMQGQGASGLKRSSTQTIFAEPDEK